MGLLLGFLLVGLDGLLSALLAPPVVAALLVTVWIMVSGALHLDGWVDTWDALSADATPEARLALMRDSRAHDAGTIAVCLLLLAKFAAILLLPLYARVPALLLAPLLGRWANVLAYWAYPYARRTPGAGLSLKAGATTPRLLVATLVTLAMMLLLLGPTGALVMLGVAATVHLAATVIRSRLPGLTGDSYGAITEGVEVLALVLVPLLGGGY